MVKPHCTHELKQTQKLILSQQMQQSLRILQLPVMELRQVIAQEIERNPLLEYSDLDIEIHHTELLESLGRTFKNVYDSNLDIQQLLENTYVANTKEEEILLQIHEKVPQPWWNIAFDLWGNLDENGFLTLSIEEIASFHHHAIEDIQSVLSIVKTFDPPGLFAQNLQEAFLLQLQAQHKEHSLAYLLVRDCFDMILHNHIHKIAKQLRLSPRLLRNVIESEILTLQFRVLPTRELPNTIFPDASIIWEGNGLKVIVHQDQIPSIRFNPSYTHMLRDASLPQETMQFLTEKWNKGKQFVKSLQQREHTLYRITEQIARHQHDFFIREQGSIKPLTMKDLALSLGLHESTVARAVANKYLFSTRGLFPLKHFFSYGYSSEEGTVSSSTVKQMIKKMIAAEDPTKPLSDQMISDLIEKKGIHCARRTVAKYRKELGLGTVLQRKHCA